MRNWHRRLSIYVGAFMLLIALSGIALQIEMMADGPKGPAPGAAGQAAAADAEILSLLTSTLAGVHRQTAGKVIGIDLRLTGPRPFAEVAVADPTMRKLRLDARSGEPFAAPADRGKIDWHRLLLDLHRGAIIGTSGLWISMACGAVLAVLSVTGFVVYIQMYRRRRLGKPGFIW